MAEITQLLDELKAKEETIVQLIKITRLPLAIDPRTGFHALPNDATLTMEYGARAYTTDVYPGYLWRNGYWYKMATSVNFTRMSESSIYSRLQKNGHDGPIHFNDNAPAVMINDSFDAIIVDGVRLFARRSVVVTNNSVDKSITNIETSLPIKMISDNYRDFYIPATGNFQSVHSDSQHSDQISIEHSYIDRRYFIEPDIDSITAWHLFDTKPEKSYIYQRDPYDPNKGRKIPITDKQKLEIQQRGMLYIKEIVPSV